MGLKVWSSLVVFVIRKVTFDLYLLVVVSVWLKECCIFLFVSFLKVYLSFARFMFMLSASFVVFNQNIVIGCA